MRKKFISLFIIVVRFVENLIGNIKGYGACPNCGDNWWWKKPDSLMYTQAFCVLICEECLSHPKRLNPQRIEQDLIGCKWEPERAALAKKAIENYVS